MYLKILKLKLKLKSSGQNINKTIIFNRLLLNDAHVHVHPVDVLKFTIIIAENFKATNFHGFGFFKIHEIKFSSKSQKLKP